MHRTFRIFRDAQKRMRHAEYPSSHLLLQKRGDRAVCLYAHKMEKSLYNFDIAAYTDRRLFMRLLLAEDERSLSKALIKLLQHEHYSADPVFNGEDALEYLRSGNYDAAILDIMMPKMDGLTVLKTIRKENNPIPVLLLTAKGEIEDRVIGLDSGANDYLPKPFNFRELTARIRAMTRTQPTAENSILKYETITLNRATFELSTASGSMRLANKEFQILEFLMTSPGNPISSERLFEKIWGTDSESDINVVWVYISYLRRKLDALNARVNIQSIRNQGYLLRKGE